MLADAHAPKDDRGARSCIKACNFLDRLRRNAANRLHLFRRKVGDFRLQLFEVLGVAGDILLIRQPLGDDRVQHRVEQRDVRAGLQLQVTPGVPRQQLTAWVHDDQLGAVLRRVLDERRRHRVIDRRISADDDNHFRIEGSGERRRHRAGI